MGFAPGAGTSDKGEAGKKAVGTIIGEDEVPWQGASGVMRTTMILGECMISIMGVIAEQGGSQTLRATGAKDMTGLWPRWCYGHNYNTDGPEAAWHMKMR